MTSEPTQPTVRVATDTDDALRAASSSSNAAGPGHLVAAARERAGLSQDELASLTRLARTTIVALERDDFGVLTEPVYVRGYYRKCAKVLNLPEAELLGAYDRLLGPKAPPMPTKLLLGNSGSTMGSMGRRGGPSLLVVLAIAMALGIFGWLISSVGSAPGPVTSTTVPVTSLPVTTTAPASVEPATAPAAPDAQTTLPATAPLAPEAATPASEPAASGQPAAAPAPTVAPAVAPAPLSAAPAATVPAATATPTTGSLVLSFRASSWVKIEDADRRVLLTGTIKAGDRQVLNGRKPYSLFIGYAPGVTIEFDGQPFDLTPHTRDNSTARISLPYVAPVEAAAPVATPVSNPAPVAH